MDFRQGTCTACKNSFRVPATFSADKAKCPKCGGVVEIGPVQPAASAPKPAATPKVEAAPSAAPPVPAKTPPPKPIPAPEPAAAAVAAAPEPAATPAPKPGPSKLGTTRVSPKPAAGKESVRSAAAAAKDRVRAKAGDGEAAADGARGRRGAAPKKKSPVPMIVGGLVLVAVVAVVLMKTMGGKEEHAAAPAAAPVVKPDLSHIPDAAFLDSTAPEDVAAMTELMKQYVVAKDTNAKHKAGDPLVSRGLRSVPAILNGFKTIDFSTEDGNKRGLELQMNLLQGQCKGTNFGWARATRPQDVASNTKVIEKWFAAWNEAKDDAEKWTAIAARAEAERAAAATPAKQ